MSNLIVRMRMKNSIINLSKTSHTNMLYVYDDKFELDYLLKKVVINFDEIDDLQITNLLIAKSVKIKTKQGKTFFIVPATLFLKKRRIFYSFIKNLIKKREEEAKK